jgi:hypothetical protein
MIISIYFLLFPIKGNIKKHTGAGIDIHPSIPITEKCSIAAEVKSAALWR